MWITMSEKTFLHSFSQAACSSRLHLHIFHLELGSLLCLSAFLTDSIFVLFPSSPLPVSPPVLHTPSRTLSNNTHTHTHTSQQYLLGSTGISQCCCLWWETWSSSQWASPSSRRRPQRPGSSSTWSRTLSSSWTWSSTFAQESSLRTTLTSF